MAMVSSGVSVSLPYEMIIFRKFVYSKVRLDDQTFLRFALFDELTFGRMGDETMSSLSRSQSAMRDNVQEELDWDAPASHQPKKQITMKAV